MTTKKLRTTRAITTSSPVKPGDTVEIMNITPAQIRDIAYAACSPDTAALIKSLVGMQYYVEEVIDPFIDRNSIKLRGWDDTAKFGGWFSPDQLRKVSVK